MFRYDLDAVYEECLDKQGKTEELTAHLRRTFEQTLSASCLRKYLKLLPDFDDIEAEEAALDFAEAYPHLGAAISFLVNWPSRGRAARIVVARAEELNGDSYHTLTSEADALEAEHPLAATLMRRAMVLDTLTGGKSTRYRHAARHLAECWSCDATITDYGDHPSHAQFLERLRKEHGLNMGFGAWSIRDSGPKLPLIRGRVAAVQLPGNRHSHSDAASVPVPSLFMRELKKTIRQLSQSIVFEAILRMQ